MIKTTATVTTVRDRREAPGNQRMLVESKEGGWNLGAAMMSSGCFVPMLDSMELYKESYKCKSKSCFNLTDIPESFY